LEKYDLIRVFIHTDAIEWKEEEKKKYLSTNPPEKLSKKRFYTFEELWFVSTNTLFII
jgi:hypothetical protein